ncbi:MAG: hypothetical protein ACTSQJ_00455 [Promethearchaeota archaeon]
MFECDNCGKRCVDKPGDWCSECQFNLINVCLEGQAKWFSESRLCQECYYADGDDHIDLCRKYKMPLYMVKRKYKCKYFREID